jgi:hypothetical protein
MGVSYSALREKDEIRLLRIEPGTGSAQVKCSLVHARLRESPTYDAVSYMWGLDHGPGSTKTTPLAIDGGRTMEVQENLGNALRYLRLRDKARVLWVDAICINQADPTERGHQVAQMGMIYSQATTVRVWLGLPDELSPKAFRFLENPGTIRRMKEGIIELDGWEAVASLCKREYWDRLWIIQELVLAARIEIHCGVRVLPWELFSNALFALEAGLQAFACVLTPFRAGAIIARVVDSAAMKICRQRRAHTESGPVTELASLLSLLWIHKDAKCVDIRDKVFGMHSFAPECCRLCVPVDYTCSAYTLCQRLLEHDIHFHSDGRRNGGRDRLVRQSLNLHGLIVKGALNQIHSKNSFEVGSPDLEAEIQEGIPSSQTPSPIIVLGNELGRVAFVTAPLKPLFVEDGSLIVPRAMVDSFQEMRFGFEESETPALTTRITRALRQIWRNNEMDILSRPGDKTAPILEMVDLHRPELQDDPAIHGLQTFMKFCCEFLRASDFLGANPQYGDCQMYLARAGIEDGFSWKVGFAPVGTEVGDSVCSFKDTNIIAIVRNIGGDHTMVGQGSTLAPPQSKSAPQTGNVVNIQFDLSRLQMFSRIHQPFELPDYRVALLMPPKSTNRSRGLLVERRNPTEVSPSSKGQHVSTTSSHNNTELGQPQNGKERPSSSPEASDSSRRKGKQPARTYSCLRCRATFETSRDNLIHAATWSHQQCNKCQQWKSWQSSTSTTSTTPICAQCSVEDTGYVFDLPGRPREAARISWQTDALSDRTDDGFRDSIITQSDDMSSSATTVSEIITECSDETYTNIREIWRSYMLANDGPFFR